MKLALIAVLAVTLFAPGQLLHAQAERRQEADNTAFGFRIGEERRYATGPPGALAPGEGELWIIRLESIEGERPHRTMRFYLQHDATRYARGYNVFSRGKLIAFHGTMDLTVNESGFPLRVEYWADLDQAASQYDHEEATLTFDDGKFLVSNDFSMRYREFNLSVPSSPLVDLSIPKGVYLSGSENPALFSLIVHGYRFDEERDLEYISLAANPFASRATSGRWTTSGRWIRAPNPSRGSSRSRRRNPSRQRLRFEEFLTIDVGGVEREALRLRRSSGLRPNTYVQEDGTVLRVDTSTDLKHTAWIRLLRPSEY